MAALRRLSSDAAYRAQLAASGYRAYGTYWSERVVVPEYLDIVRRAALHRGDTRVAELLSLQEVA